MVVFVVKVTQLSPDVEGSVSLLRLLSLSFMLNLNTVIFLDLTLYVRVHFAIEMNQTEVSSAFFLGKEDTGPGKERQWGWSGAVCLLEISVFINEKYCLLIGEAMAQQY